jgi:hypothetical protein
MDRWFPCAWLVRETGNLLSNGVQLSECVNQELAHPYRPMAKLGLARGVIRLVRNVDLETNT